MYPRHPPPCALQPTPWSITLVGLVCGTGVCLEDLPARLSKAQGATPGGVDKPVAVAGATGSLRPRERTRVARSRLQIGVKRARELMVSMEVGVACAYTLAGCLLWLLL